MHLEDLAGWRQMAYRLLSSMLLYPDEGRLKTIATVAAELHKQNQTVVKFAFYSPWQRLLTSLVNLPDHPTLEEEYIRVFMHSSEGAPCLPYESVSVDPGGQSAGWILAVLEQEYAAAGLALSPSQKELPDHVAVELEFMAFLCGREADAWNRQIVRDAVEALQRQQVFLERHLARWFPGWVRQVAIADSEGVYSIVAEAAWAIISHDRDLIGSLLDKFLRIPQASHTGVDDGATAAKEPRSGRYHYAAS